MLNVARIGYDFYRDEKGTSSFWDYAHDHHGSEEYPTAVGGPDPRDHKGY